MADLEEAEKQVKANKAAARISENVTDAVATMIDASLNYIVSSHLRSLKRPCPRDVLQNSDDDFDFGQSSPTQKKTRTQPADDPWTVLEQACTEMHDGDRGVRLPHIPMADLEEAEKQDKANKAAERVSENVTDAVTTMIDASLNYIVSSHLRSLKRPFPRDVLQNSDDDFDFGQSSPTQKKTRTQPADDPWTVLEQACTEMHNGDRGVRLPHIPIADLEEVEKQDKANKAAERVSENVTDAVTTMIDASLSYIVSSHLRSLKRPIPRDVQNSDDDFDFGQSSSTQKKTKEAQPADDPWRKLE
ncbi:hypothetical protein B0O80DRAFT_430283 [Mortierella sp. GBAus27b]|nr:hypothetical protein B0O80DRAFT_430283 [Mortierella sp. GBAus27b]